MGNLSILQKKGQVGQRGRQKRGDQPTIHLIVNFFGKKSSKDYREESTSWHNCMSSQGVDVTIKDLAADLKTMKIILNENLSLLIICLCFPFLKRRDNLVMETLMKIGLTWWHDNDD